MAKLANFTQGMRAYRQGKHARAVEALAPITQQKGLPGRLARYYTAKAHQALGIELIHEARFADAGRHLRQAAALVGKQADLAEYLLIVYARTGQYERCAAEADVVARSRPRDVESRTRLAQAQWRAGRRPMAIMTLTSALRELGDDAQLYLNLGLFYASEDDYDLARDQFVRAAECDCTCAHAYCYLGLAESARGEFAQAVRAFEQACEREPENLMYAYQLCVAAGAASQAGKRVAVRFPERAVAPAPAGSQIRQLAEYVCSEPDFAEALLALPASDIDEELFGVRASVLRTALAHHSGYADLHHLAARALERTGQVAAATIHARRAVEINPRYVKALIHLAELAGQAGDNDQAIDALARAVECGADWPDIHARLADACRQAGKVAQAVAHYRRALELNDHYEHAARGLASMAA